MSTLQPLSKCFVLGLFIVTISNATIINVPSDHLTIQAGIDAATDGDTVLVDKGNYVENINFNGKNIIVASLFLTTMDYAYISQTIIDGDDNGSVVIFKSGEELSTILCGFTITNGSGYPMYPQWPNLSYGGGIYIGGISSPSLEYLLITDNSASYSGGIHLSGTCNPFLNHITIVNNSGSNGMGCVDNSNAKLRNVVFSGNEGHGITCEPNCNLLLENVLITNNSQYGIYCHGGRTTIKNSILWNNASGSILFADDSYRTFVTVSYSDIQGGRAGIVTYYYDTLNWLEGNIDADPLFLDAANGNYQLREGSPCIDAGDPAPQYDDSCFPPGLRTERNDIGAYGGPYNCQNVSVRADFNWDTYMGDAPLTVNFSDISTSVNTTIDSWLWDFGDGKTSNEQMPTHIYTDGGIYTVSLTVTGTGGDMDTKIKADHIYVVGNRFVEVPRDQSTIQDAIDSVTFWDTVLVAPGTYMENINFKGKNIIVGSLFMTTGDTSYISRTIIHGKNYESVVTFESREDSSALLCGFTITHQPMEIDGEGIYIKNSSPTLSFLIITENNSGTKLEKGMIYGGSGGGIYFENSHSRISNVHITKNTAMDGGGIFAIQSDLDLCNVFVYKNMVLGGGVVGLANGAGISSILSNLKITNSLIAGNAGKGTVVYGGGICAYSSTISLTNVTIAENNIGGSSGSSEYYCGGGIYLSGNSEIYIVNSIVWNDNPEEIYLSGNPSNVVLAAFSDIQGGKDSIVCNDEDSVYWLNGNINQDPLFVEADKGNYNLKEDSPCINKGTAFFILESDTLVDLSPDEYIGLAPDMGAFESSILVKISEQPAPPHKFILYQNYPNPFNPVTTIEFRLPRQSDIRIDIYNINGAFVENLYNGNSNAGTYTIKWNASRYPSGIYFVKLNSGSLQLTNKLLLLK